jgi:hypothetical protein
MQKLTDINIRFAVNGIVVSASYYDPEAERGKDYDSKEYVAKAVSGAMKLVKNLVKENEVND